MKETIKIDYHDKLKNIMDDFVFEIYQITQTFPKEEQYSLTSQLRRAALSIILNYIEGYARNRKLVYKNFLEISYGSLKETKYLIYFSCRMQYISEKKYQQLLLVCEEIGAMLWGIIRKL